MKFINKLIAVMIATVAFVSAASAQTIHMLVERTDGHYYEINPNINIGGAYQISPHYVGFVPVLGYTDRVSRGQYMAVVVTGSGRLDDLGCIANGKVTAVRHNVALPYMWMGDVPLDPSWKDMYFFYHQAGRYAQVRCPIGSR